MTQRCRKPRHFIAKCTEPDPDERYQSIEDVTSAFQQVLRGVEKPEAPREKFDDSSLGGKASAGRS
jgi:serine/threonine protein kinase